MGVKPILGVREIVEQGRRQMGGQRRGENAKFGLGTAELLDLAKQQQSELGRLFSVAALSHRLAGAGHFHCQESGAGGLPLHFKLYKMGFPIRWFDVGGGLGVDYDGSQSG